MKRRHACVVGALVLGAGGLSTAASGVCPPGDHGCHVGCGKAAMMAHRLAAGLGADDEPLVALAESLDATDLLNVNLDLEVFPATTTLAGTCTLTVRAVAPVSEFTFRLRNNFAITSATLNGSTPAPIATLSTTTRRATLDRTYAPGETFTLTIEYSGPAVSRGFGSIEFQSTAVGNPIVTTLSEAFYAYTWWPSKEGDVGEPGDMRDKATFQIAITAPAALTSVSNGLLQGIDNLSGDRRRHRWATNYPQAVYLACFSSSIYNHHPRTATLSTGETFPVDFYLYPHDDTPAQRATWEVSVEGLRLFSDLFGPFPFAAEKYGMYQFPFSGGMEHQTMTGQGVFLEFVTMHELAHQWFGNDVTCRTWSDIWLNEGFATYSEALWEERKPGSSGLPALHVAMSQRRPANVSGSVYRYDTTSNTPIFSSTYSYRKAGWVVHMLRKVVGDETFFQILRDYRTAFSGSAATTDDFASIASSTSGRDLTTFFQQWIYSGGAPAYASSFAPITVNGKNYAKIRLRQVQNNPDFGVAGVFVMPVDIRLDTAGGPMTVTCTHDAITDHFVVAAPAPVTGIVVDEFNWILATDKSSEAYVAGPPVIVESVPAPGALVASSEAPGTIDLFFSDDVTALPAAFTLTGPSGAVGFGFAYDGALRRARLSVAGPLTPGEYTLSIGAGVSTAAGVLDGEITGGALPSGDGAAGGTAQITFSIVAPPCPPDFNFDGNLDPDDLGDFINCFFTLPPCPGADFNSDGNIDPDDLGDFINAFFAGC
ncbi:MAG: M1 family aminopeptidase [Phycisphaerales bacterium]